MDDESDEGAERQGDEARYLRAWFVFVGPDGEPSADRAAARISIGATTARRVRLIVPEGLDMAPTVAERVAERVAEAARIARDPGARFAAPEGNCPACWHLWRLHGAEGCTAGVYPANSLARQRCSCEHSAPAAGAPAADDFEMIREFDRATRADYPERRKRTDSPG